MMSGSTTKKKEKKKKDEYNFLFTDDGDCSSITKYGNKSHS